MTTKKIFNKNLTRISIDKYFNKVLKELNIIRVTFVNYTELWMHCHSQ